MLFAYVILKKFNISQVVSFINQSNPIGSLKKVSFGLFNSYVSCGFVNVWSIIVFVISATESNNSGATFSAKPNKIGRLTPFKGFPLKQSHFKLFSSIVVIHHSITFLPSINIFIFVWSKF